MTVKQLIESLNKEDPNADVIIGTYNGHVNTYTVCDNILPLTYQEIMDDFFGTPGLVDERVAYKIEGNIVYLNSSFPPLYGVGNENRSLNTITEKEWIEAKFRYIPETYTWKKNITRNKYITYNTRCDEILIMNWDLCKSYKAKNINLDEFKQALYMCGLE